MGWYVIHPKKIYHDATKFVTGPYYNVKKMENKMSENSEILKYTDAGIRAELDKVLESQRGTYNAEPLYRAEIVNYTSYTQDNNELYSEVISAQLMAKFDELNHGIEPLKYGRQRNTYTVANHKGWVGKWCGADETRQEERLAHTMFRKTYNEIGTVLDYQVPLKDYAGGRTPESTVPEYDESASVGKIDLVSYNPDTKKIYLLELKRPDNKETLLRAALEIYTYNIQLCNESNDTNLPWPKRKEQSKSNEFKTDFLVAMEKLINPGKRVQRKKIDISGVDIVPAVLIECNSVQRANCEYPETLKLVRKLGVEIFEYTCDDFGITSVNMVK